MHKGLMNMKKTLKITSAVLLLILAAGTAAFFVNMQMNKNVYLTKYDFYSEKTPVEFYGYRIAVISDIHNNEHADKFIELLDREKPDVLIFSGDMIQLPQTNLENVTKIIKSQKDNMKIYVVGGNHEAANSNANRKKIYNELAESGAVILNDKADVIKQGRDGICFIGAKDSAAEKIDKNAADKIKSTVSDLADEKMLNILVYHRADAYDYFEDLPVDLMLCGHLHGGIVRLPFIGGLYGGKKEYFPKYTAGMYKEDKKPSMIVSRGCDYNMQKMRVFNPPEIVIVTLHGKGQ